MLDFFHPSYKLASLAAQKNYIVHIADIKMGFNGMLYELVELIHINIAEKLAGEIANRKAFNYLCQKGFCWRDFVDIFYPQNKRFCRIVEDNMAGKPKDVFI